MPLCCVSCGNHPVDPVDPVQSSDQHGSRAFSHMWSSQSLRGEFRTAAYLCDAHTRGTRVAECGLLDSPTSGVYHWRGL